MMLSRTEDRLVKAIEWPHTEHQQQPDLFGIDNRFH